MKAKEHREKEGITDGNFWDGNEINFNAIYEFAEAYHKAKVEGISDEVIEREFSTYTSRNAIRWFKEQLLKQ